MPLLKVLPFFCRHSVAGQLLQALAQAFDIFCISQAREPAHCVHAERSSRCIQLVCFFWIFGHHVRQLLLSHCLGCRDGSFETRHILGLGCSSQFRSDCFPRLQCSKSIASSLYGILLQVNLEGALDGGPEPRHVPRLSSPSQLSGRLRAQFMRPHRLLQARSLLWPQSTANCSLHCCLELPIIAGLYSILHQFQGCLPKLACLTFQQNVTGPSHLRSLQSNFVGVQQQSLHFFSAAIVHCHGETFPELLGC
mmetsp:Transcript_40448/g.93928  ORF Transcript_40448/g.93928 Transcript_40448/m.93928 type:complete len:252 (-) Transcript_40448:452-1207(-)